MGLQGLKMKLAGLDPALEKSLEQRSRFGIPYYEEHN